MINDSLNKLRALKKFNLKKETLDVIRKNKEYLKELLIRQLSFGIDGSGKKVTVFGRSRYAPFTIRKKKGLSGLSGETSYITNYHTGNFYRGISMIAKSKSFEFKSSVSYYGAIVAQSGDIIMTLNENSIRRFVTEILQPELKRRLEASIK